MQGDFERVGAEGGRLSQQKSSPVSDRLFAGFRLIGHHMDISLFRVSIRKEADAPVVYADVFQFDGCGRPVRMLEIFTASKFLCFPVDKTSFESMRGYMEFLSAGGFWRRYLIGERPFKPYYHKANNQPSLDFERRGKNSLDFLGGERPGFTEEDAEIYGQKPDSFPRIAVNCVTFAVQTLTHIAGYDLGIIDPRLPAAGRGVEIASVLEDIVDGVKDASRNFLSLSREGCQCLLVHGRGPGFSIENGVLREMNPGYPPPYDASQFARALLGLSGEMPTPFAPWKRKVGDAPAVCCRYDF